MIQEIGEKETLCACACYVPSFVSDSLQPRGRSPPGSSVHGILQARILEWVAISSSRGSSGPRDEAHISVSPALAGRFFITSTTWEALAICKYITVSTDPGIMQYDHIESEGH